MSPICTDLEAAVAIARQRQSKTLELRATLGFARLLMDEAKGRGAHELVAPRYEGFTEGFETADMKEAKSLLERASKYSNLLKYHEKIVGSGVFIIINEINILNDVRHQLPPLIPPHKLIKTDRSYLLTGRPGR